MGEAKIPVIKPKNPSATEKKASTPKSTASTITVVVASEAKSPLTAKKSNNR